MHPLKAVGASRLSCVEEPKRTALACCPDGRIGLPFGKCQNNIQGTSMPTAFVVTPATAPAPLNVVGEHITVLASGAQTGSYEIFRQAGPEGSGPPPHCHPWDESFYVVKGEISFGVGDKDMIAEPGTLVHLSLIHISVSRYAQGHLFR